MAETQAYLEAQGYYDADPTGPPERPPMSMDELRGWTLMAFGRPAYHAMILFEEKRQGVVEFIDMSWFSPLAKQRGYVLSKLNEPVRIQLDASLEPLNAAHAFMDALTEFLGQSPTREAINVLFGEVPPDRRFTAADREQLAKDAFRIAWSGGLQRIDLLASAAEAGVRIVFSPLDLTVTIFEAADGDKAALLSLGLAATPIDNVVGISRKVVRINHVVQLFPPALQENIRTILTGRFRLDRLKRAEVMLGTGQISVADWRKIVDSGIFQQSKKYSRFVARWAKTFDGDLRPSGTVLHHYLPLEFDQQFIRAGLDPNDPRFTGWVEVGKHMGWHAGQVTGQKYNDYWRLFFRASDDRTPTEIQAELNRLTQIFVP